jgi:phosphoglycolate phosphatase
VIRPVRYTVISIDLDGTLVDTAAEIAEAANRTLEDYGLPRQDPTLVSGFIGAGTRQMFTQLRNHLLRSRPELADRLPLAPALERLDLHYGDTAGLTARPYPGCLAALTDLRDAGVRLACLTNKEHRYALKVLDATGLSGHFDCIVGGDSLAWRKPQPETVWHVLDQLGGRVEQAAHLGDSRTDVETALNAGVAAWAVPWGYNAGEPIAASGPQRIFESWPEVAAHVLAANSAVAGPTDRLSNGAPRWP